MRRGAYAGLGMFSCPTVVPVVVVVVVHAALFKLPFPDVARKFICSSSTVADMVVVPTLDNRGNVKTQTVSCLFGIVFLQIRRQLVRNYYGRVWSGGILSRETRPLSRPEAGTLRGNQAQA